MAAAAAALDEIEVGTAGIDCCLHDHRPESAHRLPLRFAKPAVSWAELSAAIERAIQYRPYFVESADGTDITEATWGGVSDVPSDLHCFAAASRVRRDAFHRKVDFTPHAATMTEAGKDAYFDSKCGHGTVFALAELIDNSIDATRKNTPRWRQIEIHMCFDYRTKGNHCLIVWDNGSGMSPEVLNQWAIFHLGKKQRKASDPTLQTEEDNADRFFLDSRISYFGVGGTQASFFFVKSVTAITSPDDGTEQVHSLTLNEDEMNRRSTASRSDSYTELMHTRGRGKRPPDEDSLGAYSLLFDRESKCPPKSGFTAIVLSNQKNGKLDTFADPAGSWLRQLANIYHFRLHPEDIFKGKGNVEHMRTQDKINIRYCLYDNEKEKDGGMEDLAQIPTLQDKFRQTAKEERFAFKIVLDGKKTENGDSGVIRGVLRYHPFEHDRETKPSRRELVVNQDAKNEPPFGVSKLDDTIFDCYWNGRWIPQTAFATLPFCSDRAPLDGPPLPKTKLATKGEEPNVYRRISGALFLSSPFQVTNNKMQLTDHIERLYHEHPVTFFYQSPKTGKYERKPQLDELFKTWLEAQHKKYDRDVEFIEPKRTVEINDAQHKAYYGQAVEYTVFNKVRLKVTDRDKDPRVYTANELFAQYRTGGEVVVISGFLLEGNHMSEESVKAPSGKATQYIYKQAPEDMYPRKEEQIRIRPFHKLKEMLTRTDDRRSWHEISKGEFKKLCAMERKKLPAHVAVVAVKKNVWGNRQSGSAIPAEAVGTRRRPPGISSADDVGPFLVYACNANKEPIHASFAGQYRILYEYRQIKEGGADEDSSWVVLERHCQNLQAYPNLEGLPSTVHGLWHNGFRETTVGRYCLEYFIVHQSKVDTKSWSAHKSSGETGRFSKMFPNDLDEGAVAEGCSFKIEWDVFSGPPHELSFLSISRQQDDGTFAPIEPVGGHHGVVCGDKIKLILLMRDTEGEPVRIGPKFKVHVKTAKFEKRGHLPFKASMGKISVSSKSPGRLTLLATITPKPDVWNAREAPKWSGTVGIDVQWFFNESVDADGKPETTTTFSCSCPLAVSAGAPHRLHLLADKTQKWTGGESIPWPSVRVLDANGCFIHPKGNAFTFALQFKKANSWVPLTVEGGKAAKFTAGANGKPIDMNAPVVSFNKRTIFDVRVILDPREGAGVQSAAFKVEAVPGSTPEKAAIVNADGKPLDGAEVVAGEIVSGLRLEIYDREGNKILPDQVCKVLKSVSVSWSQTTTAISKKPEHLSLALSDWHVPTAQGQMQISAKIQYRARNTPISTEARPIVQAAEPAAMSLTIDASTVKTGKTCQVFISLADRFGNECDLDEVWQGRTDDPEVDGIGGNFGAVKWRLSNGSRQLCGSGIVVAQNVGSAMVVDITWLGIQGSTTAYVRSGPPKKAVIDSVDDVPSGATVLNGSELQGGPFRLKILDQDDNQCTEVDGWYMTIASPHLNFAAATKKGTLKRKLDTVVKGGVADFSTIAVVCSPRAEDQEHELQAKLHKKKDSKPVALNLEYTVLVRSDPTLPYAMVLCRPDAPLPAVGSAGMSLDDFPAVQEAIVMSTGDRIAPFRICVVNKHMVPIRTKDLVKDMLSVTLTQKPRLMHAIDVRVIDDFFFGFGGPDLEKLSASFKPGPVKIVAKYSGNGDALKGHSVDGFVKGCVSTITVLRGEATKLDIKEVDKHEDVTNSGESRTIVKALTLTVVDEFGNAVTDWAECEVDYTLATKEASMAGMAMPVLEDPEKGLTTAGGVIDFSNGFCIQKGSPGASGVTYALHISVSGRDPSARDVGGGTKQMFKYATEFRFVDDAKMAQELQGIKRQMDLLTNEKNQVKRMFQQLKEDESKAKRELTFSKNKIDSSIKVVEDMISRHQSQFGGSPPSLRGPTGARDTIAYLEGCQERLKSSERRLCSQHRDEEPGKTNAMVIGYIANLVTVADDLFCRILTWHLGNNIRCLVVRDNKTAERYKREGKVLSLTAAAWKPFKWPMKVPPTASKLGGRYLLNDVQFKPECAEDARTALNATVGDVLVFPTLKQALDYRAELRSKKKACGVLYTEEGEKVAGSGVTGGNARDSTLPEFRQFQQPTFAKGDGAILVLKRLLAETSNLHDVQKSFDSYVKAEAEAAQKVRDAHPKLKEKLDKIRTEEEKLKVQQKEIGSRKHRRSGDPHPQSGRRVRSRTDTATPAVVPASAGASSAAAAAAAPAPPPPRGSGSAARVASEMGWSTKPAKKAKKK